MNTNTFSNILKKRVNRQGKSVRKSAKLNPRAKQGRRTRIGSKHQTTCCKSKSRREAGLAIGLLVVLLLLEAFVIGLKFGWIPAIISMPPFGWLVTALWRILKKDGELLVEGLMIAWKIISNQNRH